MKKRDLRAIRRAAAAAVCGALPLYPHPVLPAVLALLLMPAAGRWKYRREARAFMAAGAGWLLAWTWQGLPGTAGIMIDLGVVGPTLALGAMSWNPRRLQPFLLSGGLLAAAAALGQAMLGQAAPAHWTSGSWTWSRVFGTLGNPNVLAAYLAGILPIVSTIRPPWLRYAAAALIGSASLMTGSRGGWLAGGAGLAAFQAAKSPDTLPLLLFLAAAAIVAPWPPGRRLLDMLGGRDATVLARLRIWKESADLWRAHPLVGWAAARPASGDHPHNVLLEIAVRGGLLALAGFLPLAWILLKRLRPSPDRQARNAAALAGTVAMAVFGLADAFLTHPALAGLFWLNCGLALAGRDAEHSRPIVE